ncbi:hypothetical protein POJ06DRAFT_255835 [Lipomyces tetrasporus]|uniref:Zn(2)-C6 fungal-type domain-containing protein n=1 Tax=Lipomyces tetrasporus TaxID=54092 RepID=A0AAD7VSI4_9ASCO|nr:uncharacterized protein POJ06DRAFT_255835 [Lipomyces tetrasporus]KAJ8099055.1 hypothetical protein POJ06DRAFT_255835 [Lipomyces tetrasporus]
MDVSIQSFKSSSLATAGFLSLCPLCDKAFIKEHSYNRHLSYCRRRFRANPTTRQKSCHACRTTKTKCSFEHPSCSRCLLWDIPCIYDRPRDYKGSHGAANMISNDPTQSSLARWDAGENLSTSLDCVHSTDVLGTDDGSFQDVTKFISDLDASGTFFNSGLNSVTYASFGADVIQQNHRPQLEQSSRETAGSSLGYVLWTPPKLTATVHYGDQSTRTLTHLRLGNPASQHCAVLAMGIIRAFPQMMLRQQTFPPFIHGQWHRSVMPEEIANCMSIAQIFTARTSETRGFLWRTIAAEAQRFKDLLDTYSAQEILTAAQALLIYMIMAIIDQDELTSERGADMINTFKLLCIRFKDLINGPFAEPDHMHPSATWEDWIFAESRRRLGCLWFLITRIVSVRNGAECASYDYNYFLPVCSAKTMWEARTREEWESELAFHEVGRIRRELWNLGALVDAHRQSYDPMSAFLLDAWDASTDKLGTLMSLCVSLV